MRAICGTQSTEIREVYTVACRHHQTRPIDDLPESHFCVIVYPHKIGTAAGTARMGESHNRRGSFIAWTRRDLFQWCTLGLGLCLQPVQPLQGRASSLKISDLFSPQNRKRPNRPKTKYIVLHTTEGGDKGSLAKIRRRGEAHYFVTSSGRVYRVIAKSKIARHAGRSMWEGNRSIDNYSIGIEVVGYHNREISEHQSSALRELLRQLISLYGISPDNVLTHSMVAYGRPNRFHPYNHRGRKRCGMIFAHNEVRARLGLESKVTQDSDVENGTLKVADPELHDYLFAQTPAAGPGPSDSDVIEDGRSAWYIARERYDQTSTIYTFPDGRHIAGDKIKNWSKIPAGTQVRFEEEDDNPRFEGFLEVGKDGDTAQTLAGDAYDDRSTIYFFPSGLVRTGRDLIQDKGARALLSVLPQGTRVLVGYVYGGHIKPNRPPLRIAGVKWNYPSTFYRFPDGSIQTGDDVDDRVIPAKTLIFYQN